MGGGSWDPGSFRTHSTKSGFDTKSDKELFASRLDERFDPRKVKFRESCDSTKGDSQALIVAGDVTGSMGHLAGKLVREGMNKLITEIHERKLFQDPHVLCAAVGDSDVDRVPLQVTQFEADLRIVEQLTQLYLEGGGGGNDHEGYSLPWYFAARHTKIDCFEKRRKKGYLFSYGDECPDSGLTQDNVEKVFGYRVERDLPLQEIAKAVSEKWNVFHLLIGQGDYMSRHRTLVQTEWQRVMGSRAIVLDDYTKLSEVILSLIEVCEGRAHPDVARQFLEHKGQVTQAARLLTA